MLMLWFMCGRLEDNLQELVISFYHVSCGDRIQVIRLGGINFYLGAILPSPLLVWEVLLSMCCFFFFFWLMNKESALAGDIAE